jgi:hypothetical protein
MKGLIGTTSYLKYLMDSYDPDLPVSEVIHQELMNILDGRISRLDLAMLNNEELLSRLGADIRVREDGR